MAFDPAGKIPCELGRLQVVIGSKKSTVLIVVGLFLVAFATVFQWFGQRHTLFTESTRDFTSGLGMGLAIGTLLLGLVVHLWTRRSRES
jgi:hypothetical protein